MLALNLALKFLFASKKEKFISISAFLAIGSVALSVLVLIVVISVMSGFGISLREKIMTMTPHILIFSQKPVAEDLKLESNILSVKGIKHISPYIFGPIELKHDEKSYSATMRGIADPDGYKVINLPKYLKLGKANIGKNEIIIGTEFAKVLDVQLGSLISLRGPGSNYEFVDFKVKAIFESGLYSYDRNLIFASLQDAKYLYGFTSQVHGYGITVNRPDYAGQVKIDLLKTLSNKMIIRTWIEDNKPFFAALKTEKNVMFILLTFAVLIASLNIISTLVMLVMEKYNDIGILKAIGFSKGLILKIFLIKGVIIGFTGTLIGLVSGILFVVNIDFLENLLTKYTGLEVFPNDAYYFDTIPTNIALNDILTITSLAMLVSIIASIYPALRASKLQAVEALRHE